MPSATLGAISSTLPTSTRMGRANRSSASLWTAIVRASCSPRNTPTPFRAQTQTPQATSQEYDAGGGSKSQTAEDRLHRPLLGPYLGSDYARGRSHARARRSGSSGQSALYGHL